MSTKTGPVPCRLSVILAREAPVGVILRRGPSKLVELIRWHTDTDTFERGQWFKGRINEYCADLSPDGSHLIYLAEKTPINDVLNPDWFTCWTAISRPPWLTAIAFWPGRSPAFGGGGLFLDNQTVTLSPDSVQLSSPKVRKPQDLVVLTQPYQHIHTTRLERSGWRVNGFMYEKENPSGMRTIVARCDPSSDFPVDSYTLIDRQNGGEVTLKAAFWADWDQKGRLVFTRHGKVFAGDFDEQGQVFARELADFNADAFEAREAPAWAREW